MEDEDEEQLSAHFIGLASCDQSLRRRALKSLAQFLLRIVTSANNASSSSSSSSDAVSVLVGSKPLLVCQHDVLHVYSILFKDFAKLSSFLLTDLWFNVEADKCLVHPEDTYTEVLCCCIRIIPVLDMFNTSLSHSASMAVTDMLHQLCSLPSMSPLGGAYASREHRLIALRACLLEVFLNEILLHQDMTCPFLQGSDQLCNLLTPHAFYRQHQASIEAAFAHMLHHRLLKGQAADEVQDTKFSLPARVLLLDISTLSDVPTSVLTHIMFLVARALYPLDGGNGGALCPTFTDGVREPDQLPHGLVIGLAASVLETAMGLLSKHYSASITRDFRETRSYGECSTVTYSSSWPSEEGNEPLVSSLLRAIACALVRIVREVGKIKHRRQVVEATDTFEVRALDLGIKRVMESVAGAFSFNMPSVKCLEVIGCFDHCMIQSLGSEDSGGAIGWTLVFFAHILWYESQRGLEQVVAGEYLRVLDSLVSLLLLESNCRGSYLQVLAERSISPDFFLQTMIKPLQRAVFDLYTNKKSITDLLAFISRVSTTQSLAAAAPVLETGMTSSNQEEEVESVSPPHGDPEHYSQSGVKPRPSTMAIVRRLQQSRQVTCHRDGEEQQRPRKRTRSWSQSREEEVAVTMQGSNPFVTEMMSIHKYEESFEDLSDFIVCKPGRNYTKFYNMRIKYRRKNHLRLIWKRREEKRELLRLLDLPHD